MNKMLITLVLFLYPNAVTGTSNKGFMFCSTYGDVAFVQNRSDADLKIRFVGANEDVRISFRTQANDPGEWRVVSRYSQPDVKVYIESVGGSDIIDVKAVDNVRSCK